MATIPLQDILKLSVAERLRLMEEIWDSIAANPEEVPFPDWHRGELDRRLDHPAPGPSLTWDEVQTRLKPPR